MTFGEKLRQLREAKGLSQKALAEASKEKQQSIARWETGQSIPGFDAVQAVCAVLEEHISVFDGCVFEPIEDIRPRGRPFKTEPAPSPEAKPAKKRKGKPT